jgi:glycosyltransferase involved in cell wall biosynthesis
VRLAVYTDYPYQREDGSIWTERAFVLFLAELRGRLESLIIAGRLDPRPGRHERSHYRLPAEIEFIPLPHYESLQRPLDVARAFAGSLRRFWRALDDVDAVWLLGPHPLCLAFAGLAALRGRRVFLGVRQDLPTYMRSRRPDSRPFHLLADALEGSYRLLARFVPVVVVGPDLARRYARARAVLPINVSLIRAADIGEAPPERNWEGELTALSVGRLEAEKNPLLLADVVAALPDRWGLVVCGEGPLAGELRARLEQLGVAHRCELRGYVPLDGGLLDLYASSHALLHVSWTEGVPQILFEAFAAGLPVVATDVGGVADSVVDAALLVPPGDASAPARELERLASDPALRERLQSAGLERVRAHTIEAESASVAAFMTSF